eukprot:m51a1_g12675 hypothetical protein (248) ;mRNA; f:895-2338
MQQHTASHEPRGADTNPGVARQHGQRRVGRVQCDEIDVVYTWVDSRTSRKPARSSATDQDGSGVSHGVKDQLVTDATAESRTRDLGTLRFSLRSLQQNAPWYGQVPEWLNASSVSVVPHAAIFPGDLSAGLPTENSNAIEANLHRIPGLSQCFLYLNDDVLLWDSLARSFFVTGDSRPVFHMVMAMAQLHMGILEGVAALGTSSLHTVEWGDQTGVNADGSAKTSKAFEQLLEAMETSFPQKSRFEI